MSAEDNSSIVRAVGEKGALVPEEGEIALKTSTNRRTRIERRYLAKVADTIPEGDVEAMARQIMLDAKGAEGTDAKVINAAREWLRKVLLGDGRFSLEDLDVPPAVVRKR